MIQQADSNRAATFALYALIVGLAFLHVFITFPGLSSPAGMDQAQIARELARGNGYSTKLIRPHAVRQLLDNQKPLPPLTSLPDTYHAPLQPLLWAALFKPLESWWTFEKGRRVYMLDHVIAATGVIWLMLTLLLAQDLARRLFDAKISILTLGCLMASASLWRLAVSGSPVVPLLFFTTLSLHILSFILSRVANKVSVSPGLSLLLALSCLGMLASHWMAIPLMLGLAVGILIFAPTQKSSIIFIAVITLSALIAWFWRSYSITGDPLGGLKATLLSFISSTSESSILRNFERDSNTVYQETLIRKLGSHSADQLQLLYSHCGGIIPALLFAASLLHRFRRKEVNMLRSIVFCMWIAAFIGMCFVGLPLKDSDDNQIHSTLLPVLSMFGLAGIAVIWTRYQQAKAGLWSIYGYAIVLLGLTAWPMLLSLPSRIKLGITQKDMLYLWPPYAPHRLATLNLMTEPNEVLVADAPWSIAWYADRSALWLPQNMTQYEALQKEIRNTGMNIGGFVFSPWSTKDATVSTQLSSEYQAWNDPIMRGPMLGLGVDVFRETKTTFPFTATYALFNQAVGNGRSAPALVFYSDKAKRDVSDKPLEAGKK
jgi:hypothetical protein